MPFVMSWSKSIHHPIPEAEVPENHRQAKPFHDFVTRHADTFAAALALSERMRARAEIYRVTNHTKGRNDFDSDADIIDAVIALVASSRYDGRGEPNARGIRDQPTVAAAPGGEPLAGPSPGSDEAQETVTGDADDVDDRVASAQYRRHRRLMGS